MASFNRLIIRFMIADGCYFIQYLFDTTQFCFYLMIFGMRHFQIEIVVRTKIAVTDFFSSKIICFREISKLKPKQQRNLSIHYFDPKGLLVVE